MQLFATPDVLLICLAAAAEMRLCASVASNDSPAGCFASLRQLLCVSVMVCCKTRQLSCLLSSSGDLFLVVVVVYLLF